MAILKGMIMRKINILVTGAGAPGIMGTLYSLRHNFENREVFIVGTDVKSNVVGKYICDKFYSIPPAIYSDKYLVAIKEVCEKEKIKVLIPQNTMELEILSNQKSEFEKMGVKILVSEKSAIENSNNKLKLMQVCEKIGVPVGNYYLVDNIISLEKYAKELGWPEKKIVVKPPISNGLRGVRIIDENYDPKEAFYSEKPNSLITNFENIKKILGEKFPKLIVTEYLPGEEFTVDIFRKNEKMLVIPRVREMIRSGITFNGQVIKEKNIINYSKKIASNLGLEYCFGFQFKLDIKGTPKILECNPRVQGTMVLSTFAGANVIWLSVKAALREDVELPNINWGTRLLRYWGGIAELNGNRIGQL